MSWIQKDTDILSMHCLDPLPKLTIYLFELSVIFDTFDPESWTESGWIMEGLGVYEVEIRALADWSLTHP